jgi:hypothetical protein
MERLGESRLILQVITSHAHYFSSSDSDANRVNANCKPRRPWPEQTNRTLAAQFISSTSRVSCVFPFHSSLCLKEPVHNVLAVPVVLSPKMGPSSLLCLPHCEVNLSPSL